MAANFKLLTLVFVFRRGNVNTGVTSSCSTTTAASAASPASTATTTTNPTYFTNSIPTFVTESSTGSCLATPSTASTKSNVSDTASVAASAATSSGDTKGVFIEDTRQSCGTIEKSGDGKYQPSSYEILLGMKKRGFGANRYNGFGGKVEPGETIEECAIRELREECNLEAKNMSVLGQLFFEFKGDSKILHVYVYEATKWEGKPIETEEMRPQWFSVDEIPFDHMWIDDKHWFPFMLKGDNNSKLLKKVSVSQLGNHLET
eukprot:gene7499-9805_t